MSENDEADSTQSDENDQADHNDAETFSREYVEGLRSEAAKYRDRAKGADELRQRLHAALIALDGRLADATDLPYQDSHLDGDELTAAITALIEAKPHLARKPHGDIGQGVRGESSVPADFSGLFR